MAAQTVSHYRIIKRLGAGGTGEVFLAEDIRLGRKVAIKRLGPKAGRNKQAQKRLIREARAAATLDHPNICAIHEIGEEGDGAFIVMQYVEGETLAYRLESNPPDLEEAVDIAGQIAEALVEAHSRGVVHRDIKPQNVIITPRGQVKVLDFGLAKLTQPQPINSQIDTEMVLTDTGMTVGTVHYMSPEQARGESVDARSDIFALGALLYKCITGRTAFSGNNTIEVCAQVIHVTPPAPSQINPRIPRGLDRLTLKALEKDIDVRYQSAGEMLQELRELQRSLEASRTPDRRSAVNTAPFSTNTTSRAWLLGWIRQRGVVRAAAVIALAVAVVAAWLVLRDRGASSHVPAPEAQRWYEIGLKSLDDGAYYQASKALRLAVELDDKFALAHARLAEAYLEIDDVDKAKDELLAAVALVPNRSSLAQADASYLDAIDATVRRDFPAAVERYRQTAEQASPKEKAKAYFDLGRAYEKNETLDKAIESYLGATNRDGQLAAAHLKLGVLLGRQQKLERAKEAFNKAEEIYQVTNLEGLTEVLYERGALFNLLIKVADARVQLEKALELSKTTGNRYQQARTLLQLSSLSWSQASPEKAKQYADEAIEIAKHSDLQNLAANGLIDLGGAYYLRDEYSKAEEFYKQALDLAQKHRLPRCEARALMALGSLDLTRDSPDRAMPYIEQALDFYQPSGYRKETSRGVMLLGRAKRQKGDYAFALQMFEQQLHLANELGDRSTTASAHFQIGYLLGFCQEQYPQALSHFDESTKIDEKMRAGFRIGHDYISRGRLLTLLGRYQEARSDLDQAMSIANEAGDNSFKELLAWVYLANAQMALSQERFAEGKSKSQQAVNLTAGLYKEVVILSKYTLAQALALTGTPQAARSICEEAVQIAKEAGNPQLMSSAALAVAEVALRNKDAKRAVETALEAQAGFEHSGQADSESHAWLIAARGSQLVGDESSMYQYASRAASLLSDLEQRWGAQAYKSYLSRPDIQTRRKQINEILAQKK